MQPEADMQVLRPEVVQRSLNLFNVRHYFNRYGRFGTEDRRLMVDRAHVHHSASLLVIAVTAMWYAHGFNAHGWSLKSELPENLQL